MNTKYSWIFIALAVILSALFVDVRDSYAQEEEVVVKQVFTVRNPGYRSSMANSNGPACEVTAELRWYKKKMVKALYHWQACTGAYTLRWEIASIRNANGTFVIDNAAGETTVYGESWSELTTGDRITLHTWINEVQQAAVVTQYQASSPIWTKIHTRKDEGGACFQFTGHVDPWGVFTAGDHSYVFELNTDEWATPWFAGPNQPTVDWHVQFYRDAALTQLRTEYWFNNVANPCYRIDPPTCDSIALSVPNGALMPAGGAEVDVTITGRHGSQYRIVDESGNVVAGPSAESTLKIHALPNVTYQAQVYSETHGWTTTGCQFQYGLVPPPVCEGVTLDSPVELPIPESGKVVNVTIKGKNATQYQIIGKDGAVVAGPSASNMLSLHATPGIEYQAQVYSEHYGWSGGCTFNYKPVIPVHCVDVELSIANGAVIPETGVDVQVTVKSERATQYRIVNESGKIVAGPSADATFTLHVDPYIRYQAQIQDENGNWTTGDCGFSYKAPPPVEPFCDQLTLSVADGAIIPAAGTDVAVTVLALNATQYRLVDSAGNVVAGPSGETLLRFHALPEIDYQVQVANADYGWTNEGCRFRYRIEETKTPACTGIALSVPDRTVMAVGGGEVEVTISGQNATRYQIVDGKGTVAGPSIENTLRLHAMPNMRYQAQVANEKHEWTTSGCEFTYRAQAAQAFCKLEAGHYGDPGGRSRITAWVEGQPEPVAIEKIEINWDNQGSVIYPTKRQPGPWFTNIPFELVSRPEVHDVGFGHYKFEAWVYVAGIAAPAYCTDEGNAPDHDNVLPDPGPFAQANPEGKFNRGSAPSRLPTVGRLPFDGGNGPDKVELILWAFEKEGHGADARITAIANEGKPLARLGMASVSNQVKFDGLPARDGLVYGFQIGEHGPWSPLFCPKADSNPTTITVYWAAGGQTWLSDAGAFGDCWWLTVAAALHGWVTVEESVATYNALQPVIDWHGHRNLLFSLAQSRETGLGPRMQDAVIGLQARQWQGPVIPTTLPGDFWQVVDGYHAARAK